jgi:hypothetical protein
MEEKKCSIDEGHYVTFGTADKQNYHPELQVLVTVRLNTCNLQINNIKSVVVVNKLSKSILVAI